jgi:hypothetical protein
MAKSGLVAVALAGCLIGGGGSAAGQAHGATTSAMNGTVTDRTGAVLTGVAVAVSGEAMMGTRTTVTDARGRYEVSAMPPGEYTVAFSLPGFRRVTRTGIRTTLGATATVDMILDVADREDTVVVSGRPPLVDRSGTTIASSLDAEQLAALPASRSQSAILAATPSIQLTRFDVGGNTAFTPGGFSAYGTSGLNRPMIEGIVITGMFPLGFTLDYGSFEHVSVGLGAFGPELPWPGVSVQVVTKSGGNVHRGTVYLDYENRGWQSVNIDAEQVLRGARSAEGIPAHEANRMTSYRDSNADAGGPIEKDRLWWYASFRASETAAWQLNFPVKPLRTEVTNLGGKLTAQGPRLNRFVVFGQAAWNRQPNRLEGFVRPATSINLSEDSTTNQAADGGVWKVEWNSVAKKKFVVEVLGGQFIAGRHERPNGSSPRIEDTNLNVYGGNRDWETTQRRSQLLGSLTFVTAGWAGSHQVKLGGDFQRWTTTETWNRGYADNVLLVTDRGAPSEVYQFETPSKSVGGVQWYGAYVSDAWRVTRTLTFNLGLRFDRYRVFLPAQEHPSGRSGERSWAAQTFAAVDNLIDWNVVAPRFGASQVLTADGRTVLKASYATYRPPPGQELPNLNPNSPVWWEKFTWEDADGDRRWDPGEARGTSLEQRGGKEVESLDPNLKLGFTREVTTRLEREVAPNTSIETGVVWRGERLPSIRQDGSQPWSAFTRAVPVTDPGIDGTSGTSDDGPALILYDLNERPAAPSYSVRNVATPGADNLTWEVTARRRFNRRWSVMGGFSHTWVREHGNSYFGQAVRNNLYPLTPNDLINTGGDGRYEFRVWSARAFGTYEGPWGLRFTPFLRHQSGQPFGRTFVVRGLNLGQLRVLAEPIDTRRMDNLTLLDLRVEKGFPLGPGRRLSTFVDVFNLFNANPEQNVNWSSGTSTFLSPITIVPPRIARVGMSLSW